MSRDAVFLVVVFLIAVFVTLTVSEGFNYIAGLWVAGIVATMSFHSLRRKRQQQA